jgi:hypothetical protein
MAPNYKQSKIPPDFKGNKKIQILDLHNRLISVTFKEVKAKVS